MSDSKSVINKSTLQGIADAIRSKDGTSDDIQVSDFASKILGIPSGSGIENIEVDEIAFTSDICTNVEGGVDIQIPFDTVPDVMIVMEDESSWDVKSSTVRDLISIMIVRTNGNLMSLSNAIAYNTIAHNTLSTRGQSITLDEDNFCYNMYSPSTTVYVKADTIYRIIGIWQK